MGQKGAENQHGQINVPTAFVFSMCFKTRGIRAIGGTTQLFSTFQSTVKASIASQPGFQNLELNRDIGKAVYRMWTPQGVYRNLKIWLDIHPSHLGQQSCSGGLLSRFGFWESIQYRYGYCWLSTFCIMLNAISCSSSFILPLAAILATAWLSIKTTLSFGRTILISWTSVLYLLLLVLSM